jgi:hypothetical protein
MVPCGAASREKFAAASETSAGAEPGFNRTRRPFFPRSGVHTHVQQTFTFQSFSFLVLVLFLSIPGENDYENESGSGFPPSRRSRAK